MPSLTLDENQANYQIRAFKPGSIQVNDQILHKSIIISPTRLITDWAPQTLPELTYDYLLEAVALEPVVLLLGTGSTLVFPPLEIYGGLINKGIGIEIMDTSAACRTYNALSAENRKVVAALLLL